MEKITMDEVQIKLEQIAASLQIVSEGLSEEFTAVQTSARRKYQVPFIGRLPTNLRRLRSRP